MLPLELAHFKKLAAILGELLPLGVGGGTKKTESWWSERSRSGSALLDDNDLTDIYYFLILLEYYEASTAINNTATVTSTPPTSADTSVDNDTDTTSHVFSPQASMPTTTAVTTPNYAEIRQEVADANRLEIEFALTTLYKKLATKFLGKNAVVLHPTSTSASSPPRTRLNDGNTMDRSNKKVNKSENSTAASDVLVSQPPSMSRVPQPPSSPHTAPPNHTNQLPLTPATTNTDSSKKSTQPQTPPQMTTTQQEATPSENRETPQASIGSDADIAEDTQNNKNGNRKDGRPSPQWFKKEV